MSTNQTKPLPESHEELVDYGTEDEDNDPSPRHRDRSASEDTVPPADQSVFDHKNGTQSESDHNESLSKSDAHMDTDPGDESVSSDYRREGGTDNETTPTDSQQTDSGQINSDSNNETESSEEKIKMMALTIMDNVPAKTFILIGSSTEADLQHSDQIAFIMRSI